MTTSTVHLLKEGYSFKDVTGVYKADCSISLIHSHSLYILVDTGGPWDKEFLLQALKSRGVSPEEVTFVVGTHGHSDHIGNLNLFPRATFCVSYDICKGDSYLENNLSQGEPYTLCETVSVIATPGHTGSDISVVVKGTDKGTVVIAGDLFEKEEDLEDSSIWEENSENPATQKENREKILKLADYIVPGHGQIFKVPDKIRMNTSEADMSEGRLVESGSEHSSEDSDIDDMEPTLMRHLPDWCRDPKYKRYWTHYMRMQEWFQQHNVVTSHIRSSAQQLDPQYRQYAVSNAYNCSYWMHHHYQNMMYWQHRCQELTQWRHSNEGYSTRPDSQYRAWSPRVGDHMQESSSMPPPLSTFVPRSVYMRSRTPSCSSSSDNSSRSKRKKFSKKSGSKRSNVVHSKAKEGVTDIVLDLDPSVLGTEEEVIECHMEITDEMLEFFARSAKHRKERDAQKMEEEENQKENTYIDISRVNTGAARATTEAPRERPGIKRTSEMKLLYGKGAAMIHGMETAMQLTFDRYVDLNQPKLWPHLPLNIKFD